MFNVDIQFWLIIVGSFFTGLLFAFIVSRVGFKLGFVDVPSERSSHMHPTPKGGGLGIPIAAGLATVAFSTSDKFLTVIALVLSVFALINDRIEIPTYLRLGFELMSGAVLIIIFEKSLVNSLYIHLGLVFTALVVIILLTYIIAATNFFNFMDGINGIAGFEASISFGFLGSFILSTKNLPDLSLVAFSIGAASAGFLFLNFPKARVFMGDVGSVFLGFYFAGAVICLSKNIKEFLLLTIFQSVFYIDCISTILIRLFHGENIFRAHKKHLYQKLVHRLDWTHSKVTLTFGTTQIVINLIGLFLFRFDITFLIIFWILLFVLYWSILMRFRLVRDRIDV
jgi:Fuc2NAc and GlcNAc transferase